MKSSSEQVPPVSLWGCGYWGKHWARCLHQLGALHSICETDDHRRQALKIQYPQVPVYSDINACLSHPASRPRAAVIATPAVSHAALGEQALQWGLDICVEKPLAMTPQQGQHLMDLAQQHQRLLMVGHVLEYHPAFLVLEQAILGGQIGRIQYMYSHRLNLGKFRREEDVLLSFAPHDVGLMLRLAGTFPEHIACHGAAYLQAKHADLTTTHLRFANNIQGHIFVSWLHPFKEQRFVVIGQKGMLVWDDVQKQVLSYKTPIPADLSRLATSPAESFSIPQHEPLLRECQHFLQCIQSRQQPITHGAQGVAVLKVLQAAHQALYPMA